MDELLADLDEFLAFHHLPPRLRRICDDKGMVYDMVAALPKDETLVADDWRERFRLEDGAILASLEWNRPSGMLAELDEDVTAFFNRFRESDGIVERRVWRDRSAVLYNVFTGTPGSSHYHCIQVSVIGASVEQAVAAESESAPPTDRERSKNAPLLYMLSQHWPNRQD